MSPGVGFLRQQNQAYCVARIHSIELFNHTKKNSQRVGVMIADQLKVSDSKRHPSDAIRHRDRTEQKIGCSEKTILPKIKLIFR